MPIYEYECTQCGRVEEVLQKFSDKPLNTCRHCSGKLQKIISQSTFHLKGSGWYVTDYARKNTQSASPKKPETKNPDTPKADAKSDKAKSTSTSKS